MNRVIHGHRKDRSFRQAVASDSSDDRDKADGFEGDGHLFGLPNIWCMKDSVAREIQGIIWVDVRPQLHHEVQRSLPCGTYYRSQGAFPDGRWQFSHTSQRECIGGVKIRLSAAECIQTFGSADIFADKSDLFMSCFHPDTLSVCEKQLQ